MFPPCHCVVGPIGDIGHYNLTLAGVGGTLRLLEEARVRAALIFKYSLFICCQ